MYMGSVISSPESELFGELQGARAMITGLSADAGVDVARTFADLKSRLVVHTTDLSPEITELFALLSQSAGEIRLYTSDISTADLAAQFAQTSAQAYGGFDAVINLSTISRAEINAIASDRDVEDLVSAKLSPLAQLTRVTANRMRLVFSEGLVLNVLKMPQPASGREAAVAAIARTALAAMTATEARAWAEAGIRVNAVGPRTSTDFDSEFGSCLTNEPDIAALALYLASPRGRGMSGHVFDAEGGAGGL